MNGPLGSWALLMRPVSYSSSVAKYFQWKVKHAEKVTSFFINQGKLHQKSALHLKFKLLSSHCYASKSTCNFKKRLLFRLWNFCITNRQNPDTGISSLTKTLYSEGKKGLLVCSARGGEKQFTRPIIRQRTTATFTEEYWWHGQEFCFFKYLKEVLKVTKSSGKDKLATLCSSSPTGPASNPYVSKLLCC